MKPMLFGKYCLLERISVGGMAEVFRAKPFDSPSFKGYLALKRILPHLAEDDEFIKMFIDEAKLTVQLQHPNIVRIYELGQFQTSYYILMEFISGKDVLALQKTVRRRREVIPMRQAMFIAREIARGLHFAHHKRDANGNPLNIIHRDVSPQNILLDYRGRVKVIDFGIAKAAVQSTRTQVGVLKGKMGYMSPEQVRGEALDHRSDVFAIGTVLWEMLTNRRLFHGDNEFETMGKVKQAKVEPPSTRHDAITPEVDELVMHALTADPEDRWASAGAFANALDSWLAENPYTAEDLSVWMRSVYADDLEEERAKREQFAPIVTVDDVRRIQEEARHQSREEQPTPVAGEVETDEEVDKSAEHEPPAATAAEDAAGRPADVAPGEHAPSLGDLAGAAEEDEIPKTEIWDADILPDEGQDLAEFAAQHTVVQAGGFDASLVEDDEIDTLTEDDEPVVPMEAGSPTVVAPDASFEGPYDTPVDPVAAHEVDAERSGPRQYPAVPDAEPDAEPGPREPMPTPQPGMGPTPLGQPDEDFAPPPGTRPGPGSSPPLAFYLIAAICVALAVAGAASLVAVFVLDLGSVEAHQQGAATVVVNASPPTELEIAIDGEVVGTASPHTIDGVPAGKHVIEVRRPEHKPYRGTIEVGTEGVVPVNVELEPTTPPEGTIVLRLPDEREEIGIYLDGERQLVPDKGNLEFTVIAGEHLVEALRPSSRPWSAIAHVEPDVRTEELVEFEPIVRDFEIRADPKARVRWDGARVGRGVVTIEDVDPREIHHLRVDVRSVGVSTWKSAIGYPQIAEPHITVEFDKPLPPSYREKEFGWLQISTGDDWWEVLIDGAETGLATPIDARGKIPVSEGKHKVTLRRGETRHNREIRLVGGETFLMKEDLRFEWAPDDAG